jgi:group II intron reverse transcriptase/maturase
MNADRQSDESVVPSTQANKAGTEPAAESVEERDSAEMNTQQTDRPRTLSRTKRRSFGLAGVREAARTKPELKFENLLHHITIPLLHEAFDDLKKTAAAGIDEVTWQDYEQDREASIEALHGRIHRGSYRAKPSKRIYIPKSDGRQRPIGIAALEDKIVQKATAWVMQCIYEQDFLGFSYGGRPGRGAHDALDALCVGVTRKKVNWILDADVKGFFDNVDHTWLMKFIEHRISDKRILRLIGKWLRAGVNEDGQWSKTTVGTPQGAVISPLLANIYLHYVLDLWIDHWRRQRGRKDVVVVRYVDDFVIGFESKADAEACLDALRTRFGKFGLELHPEKTRLIEFGRYAIERRAERGEGRPETFDFLGFTHCCDTSPKTGWFMIRRQTIASRMTRTLAAIKRQLHRHRHRSIGQNGRWLGSVVRGWMGYHAIPGNVSRIRRFRDEVSRLWLRSLRRRSQRHRWPWSRMKRLFRIHVPAAKVLHPYPDQRFRARIKAGAV